MIIGLEGADGSGKSTLGHKLAADFHCDYYHSARPITTEDFNRVLNDLEDFILSKKIYIVDRLPWISELAYARSFSRMPNYNLTKLMDYWKEPQLVIYCCPKTLSENQVQRSGKPHKDPEFMERVFQNHKKTICTYSDFFAANKVLDVIRFDYETTSYEELLEQIKAKICVD